MDLNSFQPTFHIQIERETLSSDLTGRITSLVFEDHEEELDVLELSLANGGLRFTDDPLFQEGNQVLFRFGYVGNLSPRKRAVIKDIDYDFPENNAPSIRLKAYDRGFQLAGKENQKVWQKPAPGILFSEIAEDIAAAHGLTPVVTPTVGRHLRVVQSNLSDAQFLKELAAKSRDRDGEGVTGFAFYVEDDELHFHPRRLKEAPAHVLEYFTDRKGILRSFRPSTRSQGAKGAGVQTKAVGVDPRRKAAVEHRADNQTTPERASLGRRTYLVDGDTGEAAYKEQESGKIVPSFERAEGFDEEPRQEPAQDVAEGVFSAVELVDNRCVAPGLLVRQGFEDTDIGRWKADALADRLKRIEPDLEVEALSENLIQRISDADSIPDVDLVIDCTASSAVRMKLEQTLCRVGVRPPIASMGVSRDASSAMDDPLDFEAQWRVDGPHQAAQAGGLSKDETLKPARGLLANYTRG